MKEKSYRVPINWFDRVFNDQLEAYTDYAQEYEGSNADKGWSEFQEDFGEAKGVINLDFRWFEYVGKSVDPEKPAPLILVLDEYFNTIWQRIADEQGLYILASEYHRPDINQPGTTEYGAREEEIDIYVELIERFAKKYNIDRKRIYYYGLSYGDMTGYMFMRKYKKLFGGAVFMNGPISGQGLLKFPLPNDLELPVLQLRADCDYTVDGFLDGLNFEGKGDLDWLKHTRARCVGQIRRLWMECNKTDKLPKIATEGDSAYLIYEGGSPYTYHEVKNRGHMPSVAYPQIAWEQVYNVYQRGEDGSIEVIGESPLRPDEGAIALSAGDAKAYINNEVVDLDCPSLILEPDEDMPFPHFLYAYEDVNTESFYVSIDILSKGFGIEYEIEDLPNSSVWLEDSGSDRFTLDDRVISFSYEGVEYKLYTNCSFVKQGERYIDLKRPALYVDGKLMIPIKEYAEMFGKFCSVFNDAAYVSEHKMNLGYALPLILREEIFGGKFETFYDISLDVSEGGQVELVPGDKVEEGHTITVKMQPDEDHFVESIKPWVRGLVVPVVRISENEYQIHNIYGDVNIEVKFKRNWNRSDMRWFQTKIERAAGNAE